MRFTIPLRTHNPLNGQHGHWAAQASKRKSEREATALAFRSAAALQGRPTPPVSVHFTRVGPRRMDDEGCIASLKSIRDQLAEELGVDDGDEAQIRFTYSQASSSRAGGKSSWSVEIGIRPMEATRDSP